MNFARRANGYRCDQPIDLPGRCSRACVDSLNARTDGHDPRDQRRYCAGSLNPIRLHRVDGVRRRTLGRDRPITANLPGGHGNGLRQGVSALSHRGRAGPRVNPVALFSMPTVDDMTANLLDQDGCSAAVSPACWPCGDRTVLTPRCTLPGDPALCSPASRPDRSAGTFGGTTNSFGLRLQPITDGLGFVPNANGVHYEL